MKLIISIVFVLMVIGCASSTKVEIEPGESVELIIVEPQEEAIERTLKWDWKTREYLRRKKKEDAE